METVEVHAEFTGEANTLPDNEPADVNALVAALAGDVIEYINGLQRRINELEAME